MMKRNRDDVWPNDAPIGTFDIVPVRRRETPSAVALFQFVCPKGNRCSVLIGPEHTERSTCAYPVWAFDGNTEAPTLTPSINCEGCWHGNITAGEFK